MVWYKIGGGVNCYDCWRGSVPHHDVVVEIFEFKPASDGRVGG